MLNRTASTQYNDWTGGVAFDDADFKTLSDYARSASDIQANDIIVAFDASYSHVTKEMMVTINYTNMNLDDFKASGTALSKKDFDLPLTEFFELFKRANFNCNKERLVNML